MDSFIRHIPIIGFNSGNYDINLTKDFRLVNYLLGDKGVERLAEEGLIIDVDDEGEKTEDTAHRPIEFIAKKGNKYLAIQSQKLLWLDMSNYLAAGTSLDKFISLCGTGKKLPMCYEWLDSFEKLNYPGLPPREEWYSSLKGKHITNGEWKLAQKIWKDNNMKTFADYLEYYNNNDIEPFMK